MASKGKMFSPHHGFQPKICTSCTSGDILSARQHVHGFQLLKLDLNARKKMVYDASPYLTLLECQKKWFLMPTLISPYLNARKKWFMMPPLILPYLNARKNGF